MSDKPDGGPAFPITARHMVDGLWQSCDSGGMTLRDYFAGQFLAGIVADPTYNGPPVDTAKYAYETADAMLAERAK